MKNILLTAVSFAAIVSCSTPKYTYYFDRYSYNNASSAKASEANLEWSNGASETTTLSSLSVTQPLTASTAKTNLVLANQKGSYVDKSSKSPIRKFIRNKNGLGKPFKELGPMKKTSPDSVKEGNKSKNGFAIAGFILAFLPLISLVVPVFPLNAILLIGGFVAGITCSIIGLKSEKRGLAKAGLIIGLITTVLAVILVALYVGSGSN